MWRLRAWYHALLHRNSFRVVYADGRLTSRLTLCEAEGLAETFAGTIVFDPA